uniref:EB domain-containing protein n=1 Tax=Heterorhabditis bacteriophora TaxID=37862 RepID=A0A1I7X232_HETBA
MCSFNIKLTSTILTIAAAQITGCSWSSLQPSSCCSMCKWSYLFSWSLSVLACLCISTWRMYSQKIDSMQSRAFRIFPTISTLLLSCTVIMQSQFLLLTLTSFATGNTLHLVYAFHKRRRFHSVTRMKMVLTPIHSPCIRGLCTCLSSSAIYSTLNGCSGVFKVTAVPKQRVPQALPGGVCIPGVECTGGSSCFLGVCTCPPELVQQGTGSVLYFYRMPRLTAVL